MRLNIIMFKVVRNYTYVIWSRYVTIDMNKCLKLHLRSKHSIHSTILAIKLDLTPNFANYDLSLSRKKFSVFVQRTY